MQSMGNKRSTSALRKNAAAKKRLQPSAINSDSHKSGSLETACANKEDTTACQGRGMRIKKPSYKLTDNIAEEFPTDDYEEIAESSADKKLDADFVPDMANRDSSSDKAIVIDDNAILS
jgi:hypothetical protein